MVWGATSLALNQKADLLTRLKFIKTARSPPLALGNDQKKPPRFGEEGGGINWQRPTFAGPIAQLSSAQQRFTSVFGMGTGGATVP